MSELGIYSVAAMMAALPTSALLRLGGTVVFPAYSRARDAGRAGTGSSAAVAEPGTTSQALPVELPQTANTADTASPYFQRIFDRVRLPLLAGGGLAAAGLIAGGPPIIQVLYDARYHQAGWMLQLLAISGWFQVLQVTNGSALLALNSPKSVAASNITKLVSMVLCIPLGFWARGLPGAILGIVLSDVLKYVVSAAAARRKGLHMITKDLLLSGLVGVTASAAIGAGWLVHGRVHLPASWWNASPWAASHGDRLAALGELLVMGVVTAVVWVPVIARSMRARKAVA